MYSKVILPYIYRVYRGFPCGSAGKGSTCNAGDLCSIPGWEDPLEKGKVTHSSILAQRVPWTVQCMGLQRVSHDWVTFTFTNIYVYNEYICMLSCFSRVQLFAMLWSVACQAPLSMGFSRQEYWSGLPCPPPGIFPTHGLNPCFYASFIGRQVLYH